MVQGGMFTQPFCSEDLSVLLKNEKLKYVLIPNKTLVLNPLPSLDKKILLIYPSPPLPPHLNHDCEKYMLTYCLCLDEPELFPIESV